MQGGGLVAQSCPTLATPYTVARQALLSVHGISQARMLGCHFLLHLMQGAWVQSLVRELDPKC